MRSVKRSCGGIRSLLMKIRLAFSFAVSCRATAYEHQTKGGPQRVAGPFSLMSDRDSSQSVLALKYDDDFRRLGFVGRQTGQLRIAPVGKVYHRPCRRARVDTLLRLYDIQSVAVEEERVVAKHFVQFRHQRMVIGDHLGFELGQRL